MLLRQFGEITALFNRLFQILTVFLGYNQNVTCSSASQRFLRCSTFNAILDLKFLGVPSDDDIYPLCSPTIVIVGHLLVTDL